MRRLTIQQQAVLVRAERSVDNRATRVHAATGQALERLGYGRFAYGFFTLNRDGVMFAKYGIMKGDKHVA